MEAYQNEQTESIGHSSPTVDVVRWCKAHGLPAELVGRWVWIEFASKPASDVRTMLKAAGFRWVSRRFAWAHSCGIPSHRSVADPRNTYGAVPVDSLDLAYENSCAEACGLNGGAA